jgi:hypothetical protein
MFRGHLKQRKPRSFEFEVESALDWRAVWDWQRPACVEVESQVLVEPDFVEAAASVPGQPGCPTPLYAYRAPSKVSPRTWFDAGVRPRINGTS